MTVRIGINGGGRIGRLVLRRALATEGVEVAAINTATDTACLAYTVKYDSVHGRYPGTVEAQACGLCIDGRPVPVFARTPPQVPWAAVGADVVVEASGGLTDPEKAARHLDGGAQGVVITAPPKGSRRIPVIVMGVNEHALGPGEPVVSAGSCTTNCLAPMAWVLHRKLGIRRGSMTTVHALTRDQQLLDGRHTDLRRARGATTSMAPTTTGAAATLGQVIPELQGRLHGMAVRVPVPVGSLVDLVVEVESDTTADEVNAMFRDDAGDRLSGILDYTEEPLVSADIVGDPHSCVLDAGCTQVVDGRLVKVCGWYDNEWAYACRCIDLASLLAERVAGSPCHPARNGSGNGAARSGRNGQAAGRQPVSP